MADGDLSMQRGFPAQTWWHVQFCSGNTGAWFHKLSPRWAGHCFAYSYHPVHGVWVVVDPLHNMTAITLLTDEEMVGYLEGYGDSLTVRLLYQVAESGIPIQQHRLFQTCSSIIGRIVGSPGSALRPIDLYKNLLADTAIIKKDYRHVRKSQSS